MLFQPEHILPILLDRKTQTRRAYRPDEPYTQMLDPNAKYITTHPMPFLLPIQGVSGVGVMPRLRFQVGRTEPVMPGRGKFQVCHTAASGEERWCGIDQALEDSSAMSLAWAQSMIREERRAALHRVRQAGYKLLFMQTLAIRLDEDVVRISDADAVAEGVSPDSDDPGADYLRIIYRINKPALVKKLDQLPQRGWRDFLRETVPLAERKFWVIDFKRMADEA